MSKPSVIPMFLGWMFLVAAGSAGGGELRQIELTDGSVLTGEVLSYEKGVYSFRTGALGTVAIEDARVRSISTPGAAAPTGPQTGASPSLREQMQSDAQIMEMIRALKDDPAFREVLEDPDLLRAVETGDLATLMGDRRFLRLLENPNVMEIGEKMAD